MKLISKKEFENKPLQICVEVKEVSTDGRYVTLKISHNLNKPKLYYNVQTLTHQKNFPPFHSYKNKLLKKATKAIRIKSATIKVSLITKANYQSHLISVYGEDCKGYKTGPFRIELLTSSLSRKHVMGYYRKGYPEKIHIQEGWEPREDEARYIHGWLTRLVQKKKSDLKKAVAINHAVFKAVGYQAPSRIIKGNENLKDLIGMIKRGDTVCCGASSRILLNCLKAFKIYSRRVEVFRFNPPIKNIMTNGHTAAEYFDRDLNKWVFLDSTYNCYFKVRGEPASVVEIQEAILEKRYDDIEVMYATRPKQEFTAPIVLKGRTEDDYDYFSQFRVLSLPRMT
jgi:hypothetical protein